MVHQRMTWWTMPAPRALIMLIPVQPLVRFPDVFKALSVIPASGTIRVARGARRAVVVVIIEAG